MNTVKEFQHKNLTIKIVQDTDPDSPRDWDNLGTMTCFHRRYSLGDKHPITSQEELQELVERKDVIALPLFLMDHGSISISTDDFGCKWDSGQVGYIYVTKEKILKDYGKKVLTKKLREQVITELKQEVKTYNEYLNGEVYGFVIENEQGEHLDSCFGHYGLDYCIEEAKNSGDYYAEQEALKAKSDFEGKVFADNYGMVTVE